jgi:hypothetical protein
MLNADQLALLDEAEAAKDKTLLRARLEALVRKDDLYGDEHERVRAAVQAARAAEAAARPVSVKPQPVGDEVTRQLARLGIKRQTPPGLPDDQLTQLADLVADRLRPKH